MWPKEFEQFKAVATNNYKLGLPKNNKKSKSKTVNKTQVNKVNSAIVNNVEKSNERINFRIDKPQINKVHSDRIVNNVNSNCKKPKAHSGVKSQSISPAKTKAKQVIERPPVVSRQTGAAPLPAAAALPAQTGLGADCPGDACDVTSWPPRRALPELPAGPISQQMGIEYCQKLCDLYPEVFDDSKGCFKGAEATMVLKPGGLEAIKKSGPRPVCKIPYGLEDQYEKLLTKLYEDLDPIDGKDLITASQIVPVIVNRNGERVLKRLAINYKS